MPERGKFCSNAVITTALAVSGGNRTSLGNEAIKLSSYSRNEQYTYKSDHLYATPRLDLQEIGWVEAGPIETDSKFVAGSLTATTTTRNNSRCCRTLTSSGYSSHSPPLSASSYSCYASAVPGQNFFRTVPLTMRDQICGGLAVIQKAKAIPRPIWPTVFRNSRELCQNDKNPEYDSLYTYCGCGCTYAYKYYDWEHEKSSYTSAHDILLELSRTLNSVIEGQNTMTPEEILYNISHKVAHGIGLKAGINEYVYHKSCFLPIKRSFINDENSRLNCKQNFSPKINPVNSKLYSNARHFHVHNPTWYTCLCSCEHIHKFVLSSKNDEQIEINGESGKRESPPVVLLMNDHYLKKIPESALQNNKNSAESHICKCLSTLHDEGMQNINANRHIFRNTKETKNINDETKQTRKKVISNQPGYVMHSESTNGDPLKKGIVFSCNKNNWDYGMRGFAADLDFTLDVSRAERLGHAIIKAKRKRQWCRVLTAVFGLVFFLLSVVIVSLSVTRGRKVFGSM